MKAQFPLPLVGLALLTLTGSIHAQPVITSQPVNPAVVWGGNATFSVTATGAGPFTYQWQLNGTNLPNNIITTVAGGNLFNNLPATNTILKSVSGVATDGAGNLYIADTHNNVIRKVDAKGMATIVAGNGGAAFSGDGGAATNACILGPSAVIVDPVGNLLIADSGNYRIRKVDINGVITTIAGNGNPFLSGNNVAATNTGIGYPSGICMDHTGNLYIADSQDNCIAKVGINGIISIYAGHPSPGVGSFGGDYGLAVNANLNMPTGLAMDSSNNLYIADSYNQ
jgi:hypothetical protein